MLYKHVITGPPCSGKTTLLRLLAEQSYPIITEAARAVIAEQQAVEQNIQGTRGVLPWYVDKFELFQVLVTIEQIALERAAEKYAPATVFCDRSLVDQIAYCRVFKANEPLGLRTAIREANYGTVYMLSPVPYCTDDQRHEDFETAQRIDEALRIAYDELAYRVVNLPDLGSAEARLELIQKDLVAVAAQ